ncbi:MAG: WYL domain-containing protein [Halolamina sp.]
MRETICDAIGNRQVLEFLYRRTRRVVEPHKIGKNRAGDVVLLGYQVGGDGVDVDPPDWGVYRLDNIASLVATDRTFSEPRSNYSLTGEEMAQTFCWL